MIEAECSQRQKNKKWPQYVATLTCAIAMFTTGIHCDWPSPSLPILLSKNHPLHLTSEEVSYVTIIATLGNLFGSVIFTTLADKIGRKRTILFTVAPQICSVMMLHFSSYSKVLLYLARFIGGISEMGCNSVLPLYIGEISEPEIRGILLSALGIFWLLGALFVDIVGSYNSIETTSLITLFFPLLFLATFSWMPDSPYYFLKENRTEEARNALRKLRRNKDVEEELNFLSSDVKRQMSEGGSYKDLVFIKSNRKTLLVMVIVAIIYQFSGVSALLSYAQVFCMKTIDFLPRNYASSLLILLSLFSTIVSYFFIDYIGRRRLLLSGLVGCASSLTFLSIYFFLDDYSSLNLSQFTWFSLIFIILFVLSFNFGICNIFNCLIGEMFSANVKTKSSSISLLIFSICTAASTKMYQSLSDSYGFGVPFTFFALCQWSGLFFCYKFVPETKGKTLEEIQQDIKAGKR